MPLLCALGHEWLPELSQLRARVTSRLLASEACRLASKGSGIGGCTCGARILSGEALACRQCYGGMGSEARSR
eukprot:CAMPEP_0117573984 /NCGR_PEP_ID=MMETSP0784-20121206/61299_1 /TAXON_ID=39447 /ORGANISM="" /LENGTH=72 /DNA_ID=CAMNT_0005372693 /DNA_START=20 /DNA_END=234 /DNA_ORIENTATION=+